MTTKELFQQMTIPLKSKLSEEDYEALLVTAEDFAQKIMPLNFVAQFINQGWNIHFYAMVIQINAKDVARIFFEADYVTGLHLTNEDTGGTETAQDTIVELVNMIAEETTRQKGSRIIN